MLDLREGTNRTGCNPKKEKLVKHIGISGHWNSAALMYAIRRDVHRLIDTLLVTVNPSDSKYLGHRHNAIATAAAADMGIIGMRSSPMPLTTTRHLPFRTPLRMSTTSGIGGPAQPGSDSLCPIGHRCQHPSLSESVMWTTILQMPADRQSCGRSAQAPLNEDEMAAIQERVSAAGKDGANAYFQRPALGLTSPRNAGTESDSSMPAFGRRR